MAYIGFSKLKAKVAAGGARNPGAVAASIGRKKYGKEAFQHAAATGHGMRGYEKLSHMMKTGQTPKGSFKMTSKGKN